MEKAQYRYRPLEHDDTIRILTLDPGEQGDPLTGALEIVPINSAGSYEALSYVWADPGPPDIAYEILIRYGDYDEARLVFNGGSIFAALCHLRLPSLPRRIWADQCCINQDDQVERSKQVRFMNRIYQNAIQVLVWLGLDVEQEGVSAFGIVCELDKILGNHSMDLAPPESNIAVLEKYVREKRKALQALADCVWFRRGWIVQEIGTGTPATMLWGNATINWQTLARMCERLKSYHYLRSTLGITTSDISFLYRRFVEPDERTHHVNRFNFVYELQRARHLNFSDDRDRIFAFLGHFSVRSTHPLGCGPLSIAADYTKTVEQTYINVAVQILRQNPASFCIIMAAVQHPCSSLPSNKFQTEMGIETWLKDKRKLPSWVPDWRWSEGIILAEPICPHRAHGNSAAGIEILEGANHLLRAHGVEIDMIESCSRRLVSEDFYKKKTSHQPLTTIEGLWHKICKKSHFNLSDTYLNAEIAFFAFMQTLSNGCVQAAGHESIPYHEVPDQVWLRMEAKYIVETHRGSNNISEDIQRAAAITESEDNYGNWDRWATSAAEGRIFARTRKGYYVLGPAALEEGDVVCVLFGAKVPFCFRPMGKRYLLVGECYTHGFMNGEVMDMIAKNQVCEKVFEIV